MSYLSSENQFYRTLGSAKLKSYKIKAPETLILSDDDDSCSQIYCLSRKYKHAFITSSLN